MLKRHTSPQGRGASFVGYLLTIRLKLLFLVVLACMPALGLALYTGIAAERQALREAEAEAGRITRILAMQEQHLTTGTRQFLATLARLPAVRDLDAKACGPLFRELLAANPLYSDVVLTARDGAVLASSREVPVGLNLKESAFFPQVVKTGDFAVGGYRKSRTSGLHVLVCGYPVHNAGGELVGTVSTGLRLSVFDAIANDIILPEGSTISMADREGLRLFHRHFPNPKPELYPIGQPLRANVWRLLLDEPKGKPFFGTGADGKRRMYLVQASRLHAKAEPYLYVGVSLLEANVLTQARRSLYSGLAVLSLATALAAAAAWYVGKKVFVDRIERLAYVAGRFAAGELTARANLPFPKISGPPDELDLLGQGMNRIGEELSRREAEREATLQRLARTQFAVDNSGDEIYWLDEAGRCFYANQRAAASLGHSRELLLGMTVFDIDADMAPGDWQKLLHQLADGKPLTVETHHRTSTGELIPKEITLSLVNAGQGAFVFGTGRDIRQRKRHEAALRSLLDETSAVTGQAFFDTLTQQLVSVLDVYAAFAGEHLGEPPHTVRPLVLNVDASDAPAGDFPLALSPGQDIPPDGHLHIASGVQQRYPQNPFLLQSGVEGYLGVPLLNAEGAKIGHLSIMTIRPLAADPALISILRLFAQRASAELVRLRAERAMLASLREKEILLKEIHHRVKNNMQIVSSLLSLQAREVTDPTMLALVAESRARILSMALVHEDLYQSDNLAQVDFRRYLERLAERTLAAQAGAAAVRFELALDELSLAVDKAVPLGLLCNELLTNALKHAFIGLEEGLVTVRLEQAENQATLTVRDNGLGLPQGFDPELGATLGLQLVWSLADQLHGVAEAGNDGGAVFTVRFPLD